MTLSEIAAEKIDKLVGQTLGGCRLVRRLGAGAIGVVYEAEQVSVQRKVAVKMLTSKAAGDDKVIQRFDREARLCAAIQHPHVVAVYNCGFERGVHYLVMEFVDGYTLSTLVEEEKQVPWEQAAQVILQVARGLEYAHGQGIIHRDIKPANILVTREGIAKLADLGLAKQLEDERSITGDGPNGLTMQGIALGSPAYMPPEQIRSARDVTPSCDLYSLGATFYQLITGTLPFDGRSAPEVMTKVLREKPRPILEIAPNTPPAVVAFINRTLEKEVDDRPKNAGQFIVELENAIARPHDIAKHPSRKPQTSKTANRSPNQGRSRSNSPTKERKSLILWWIIVGLIALLVIGVISWRWFVSAN
jgi:eukaryotic-like serine/threonine-protein kinase